MAVFAVAVPSTAPSVGLEIVAVTLGLCVPHTWSSVVATVKVLLVSPAAKVTVPLWPFADQLTASLLATLSPAASVRLTVNVGEEPSVAENAFALIEYVGAGSASVNAVVAVAVPSTAPSEGFVSVAVTLGLCVPHTWSSVVATVKVLLVSPAAKVTLPLCPFAHQLTVSPLA